MPSIMPQVIDYLLGIANSLETVSVYDGFGVSEEPGDFVMIGVPDPNTMDATIGGTASQDWQHIGHQVRNENGEITCVALSWNGDNDVKAARDGAFAITAKLETALKNDPSMGGICLWSGYGTQTDYWTNTNDQGAECFVVFRIAYRAYI